MTEFRPNLTERAQAEAQARRAREAEALRENLRRRKTQARARENEARARENEARDRETSPPKLKTEN